MLSCKSPEQTAESVADTLRDIKASIGVKRPPIPEESKEIKDALLGLIKDGPGEVKGHPTVSPWTFKSTRVGLNLFRLPSSEQVYLACVPDTS